MPKNIVLLADGTGNSAAKLFRTNVWRMYEALDLSGDHQIAYYHDGVGTSSFAALAAIGGAFGWGLKRNVLDLYAYLCEHYKRGDRIYAFGFSRGAFTIRVLVGLIDHQGIIAAASKRDLRRLAAWAYREYRRTYHTTLHLETPVRNARDFLLGWWERLTGHASYSSFERLKLRKDGLAFVGVWDTVDAYGLPIDELTDGIDRFIWPLSIPNMVPSPIIARGCHALALDDERQTFHPVLWEETDEHQTAEHIRKERITQVWFTGVHANVGGGYADDRLAHVPLVWMMDEAEACGVKLQGNLRAALGAQADRLGHLYDSRAGLAGYYRYCPRTAMVGDYGPIAPRCSSRFKIHESVFARIRDDPGYAPIVLPRAYAVVDESGGIHDFDNGHEPTGAPQAERLAIQARCWDLVWWKRNAYFATLAVTAALLLLPAGLGPLGLPNVGIVLAGLVGLAGSFLPSFAAPVVEYFKGEPLELIIGGITILALMSAGTYLENLIADRMRTAWMPIADRQSSAPDAGTWIQRRWIRIFGLWTRIRQLIGYDLVHAFRTCPMYRRAFGLWSRHVAPSVFGAAVLALILVLLNRAAFELVSSRGGLCVPSANVSVLDARSPFSFKPAEICHATGLKLERSKRYRIDLSLPRDGWSDESIRVEDAAGISAASSGLSLAQRLLFLGAVPARRIFRANVLTPIARIDSKGADHYVLSTPCTILTARKDGELFLFVNDVVLPARQVPERPWIRLGWESYYANNYGEPAVGTVTLVADPAEEPTNCRTDIGMQG